MKRIYRRSTDFQRVMDYLREEHTKGVRIVHYIPLSNAVKVSASKLALMLMSFGGGNHGIRLTGEMFD